MRELKFRLVLNDEIVGYERHRRNEMLRDNMVTIEHKKPGGTWNPIIPDNTQNEIYHNEKDIATGFRSANIILYVNDVIRCEYAGLTPKEGKYYQAKIKGIVLWSIDMNGFEVYILNKEERYGGENVEDPRKVTVDVTNLSLVHPDTIELLGNKYENPDMVPERFLEDHEGE